jgi:hypothetical protein
MEQGDMTYEDFEDTELAAVLSTFEEELEDLPFGFGEKLKEGIRRDLWWRAPARRLAHDRRTQYAAASFGGALVGAVTIAVLVWRRARRPDAEQTIAA